MVKSLVVAFAFGVPDSIQSNTQIVEIAAKKAAELGAIIYAQLDLNFDDCRAKVKFINEKPGEPSPTLRMARGAVELAKQQEIKEIWIVCALPHLWRCRRDLEAVCREKSLVVEIKVASEILNFPEDIWFCEDSSQKRTRTRKN